MVSAYSKEAVNITALGVRSTRYGLAVYYQTHLLPTAGNHGERVLQGGGKYYSIGSAFYEVWSGRLLPDAPTPNGG
jgi:hypothetical protein